MAVVALAVERRLVAIMIADVVGYSRLMGDDEPGTLQRMKSLRHELLEPLLQAHRGRLVNFPGDSALCEFSSAVEAVQCAIELQRALIEREAVLPEDRRLRLRIGVNLGDIMFQGGEIFGDGVNIAARLQTLAEPGGIAVSRVVHEAVKRRLALAFEACGVHRVKNIKDPVEVWRVLVEEETRAPARRPARPVLLAAAGAVLLSLGLAAAAALLLPAGAGPDQPALAAVPRHGAVERSSVAVMPFYDLGDSADGVLAAGLAEDILTELSRNRDLRIIARDTSFTLAAQKLPPIEIGRRLGVSYVLAGSVRRTGEELRINVRLLDSATGDHVWADRYVVGPEKLYTTQDEIIRQITGRLSSEVRYADKADMLRRAPDSMDVYELTMRAFAIKHRLDRDSLIAARALLEDAIARDPDYAPAQLYLGQVDTVDISSGGITGRYRFGDLDGVIARIRGAINLDPSLPAGYRVLSQALGRKGDAEGSLQAALRSVELAPSNADNLNFLGVAQIRVGQYGQALTSIDLALDLNPIGPAWYHGYRAQALYALDRPAESLAAAEACAVRAPRWITCHLAKAAALVGVGQVQAAGASIRQILELNPQYNTAMAQALTPYPRDPKRSERYVADLREAGLPDPAIAADVPEFAGPASTDRLH
jgi:adenylate cyclase